VKREIKGGLLGLGGLSTLRGGPRKERRLWFERMGREKEERGTSFGGTEKKRQTPFKGKIPEEREFTK